MGKEIECKLLAPSRETLSQVALAFAPAGQITSSETLYYDLGPLSERKWMFRVRISNSGAPVYTFKAPGSGYERVEFECEAASVQEAARKLSAAGAPSELAQLETFPVLCGARFERTTILLEAGGAAIELALDDGVLTAGERTEPICEVELELKAGPVEPMLALKDRLAEEFSLTESTQSKFARARALALGTT